MEENAATLTSLEASYIPYMPPWCAHSVEGDLLVRVRVSVPV